MNVLLLLFTVVWASSWGILLTDAGRTLPHAPQDRIGFLVGEIVVGVSVLVLIWLARKRPPIDHRNDLAIRQPKGEAVILLIYLVLLLVVGRALGVGAHIASIGLTEGNLHAWSSQTPASVLRWAGFNFFFGALLPLLVFTLWRRYSLKTLLLGLPDAKRWISYALVTAAMGLGAFAGPAYFRTSAAGHLLTLLLFSLGTFLPVMILTQSLLAPRLAIWTKSWVGGSVAAGGAYALYHLTEFFLEWGSGAQAVVSSAWLMQFAYFGFLKAVTTLRTGSAWIHIFNTHAPHLAEAPEVARVFSLR